MRRPLSLLIAAVSLGKSSSSRPSTGFVVGPYLSRVTCKLRGGVLERTNSTTTTRLSLSSSLVDEPGSTSIEDLWQQLESSPQGLSSRQVEERLQLYGPNTLASPPGKSTWQLILEQFEDRLVQILLGVAVLSGLFSVWEVQQHAASSSTGGVAEPIWKSFVEPLVIVAILLLNAAVGVWQSQSAQGSLEALKQMQPSLATVLRTNGDNGDTGATAAAKVVDASGLVPGDVIEVRVGDKIPADARLLRLQSSGLQVDEGSLTGESVTVPKLPGNDGTLTSSNKPLQDQKGMLYSGTMITSGSGQALVVNTGMSTQMGKVSPHRDNIPCTVNSPNTLLCMCVCVCVCTRIDSTGCDGSTRRAVQDAVGHQVG